ncbi:hypothetical protein ULMS_14230 [Patiriisocius marinistellae]|uniref:Uncharacterized protein n=1 Tax=Patiriisocius marinistellae TaxID=2494560 RepID=A0A5J4G0Q6_9FLAO|nr:hypothetical protein [Patiriisocius marinistellae]GEQ85915.1 hypothetical protein ULMS_14230 [Patiriisocius marinistellae]
MNIKYLIYTATVVLLIVSCKNETPKAEIVETSSYEAYLNNVNKQSTVNAEQEVAYWSKRLDKDTTGIGDIGALAGAYSSLFDASGNINALKNSEVLYKRAIEIAASKDPYVRGLAHNYISQHRFKEAKTLLEDLYAGPTNKRATEFMLFDVYMELGEYEKADQMLGNFRNNGDYNYLIRVAKWSDYNGELDSAIRYLEKAKDIAESRDTKALKIWTYSNIADFYGHAGRLNDSYNHYIKTLELQPDNSYSKKGIAWMKYSKEKNTTEANRILDSIIVHHNIPDYYLLKAEMAEFDGDTIKANAYLDTFMEKAANPMYGAMYNTYKIEVLVDRDPVKALALANEEVNNRETPEAYQLLALAQLKNGQKKEALKTIEEHVAEKTYEPMALYHSALVYQANGLKDKVEPIKEELQGASYEIGPVLAAEVEKL